jgi:Spy/CpxP family protein refolding chaperone
MNKRSTAGWLAAIVLALPLYAIADPAKPDWGKEHGPDGPRLFLVLRMADALDLSDEKALAVSRVLKQADEKRDELRQKRSDLEDRIREALKKSKPDEAALAKLIDQSSELHQQQERVAEDSFTALKKVLTVEQQARLVLLRSSLRHEFGPRMHEGGRFHGGEHRWRRGERGPGPDRGPESGPGPGHPPPGPGDED